MKKGYGIDYVPIAEQKSPVYHTGLLIKLYFKATTAT